MRCAHGACLTSKRLRVRHLHRPAAAPNALPASRRESQVPSPASASRRGLHGAAAASLLAASLRLVAAAPARANGLLQFPTSKLGNNYLLIRAGQAVSESQDYVLTNPAWKTSGRAGLSAQGKQQVVASTWPAVRQALESGCWLWPSMAQSSYMTAEILAALAGMSRSRIVPEYSFLDARGVGAFEGGQLEAVAELVREGDALAPDWRPPAGTDGTPNESAADVAVRSRQLLSLLETQFSGDTVLIISPDSDNLSILQAMVLGEDLRGHAARRWAPGEVRALLLPSREYDDSPRTMPCERPPHCK